MSRQCVQQINPIIKRINMKLLNVNGRYFMIGGSTINGNTNDIFQFRILQEQQQLKVQWRPLKFQNNIFTPRQSFAACSSKKKIYIWGGQSYQGQNYKNPKILADLIQIDIENYKMRLIPLSQKIHVHSSILEFDQIHNQLIAYCGSNQSKLSQTYLYKLNLNSIKEQYTWEKKSLKNLHNGYIWQHKGKLLNKSIFSGKQGNYLLVVGGCRQVNSPYKQIIQIDIQKGEIENCLQLQEGLIAHQVLLNENKECAYIIGGSNGAGFNRFIFKVKEGKLSKFQGHNAVGCSALFYKQGLLIYGGVCGPEHINGMLFYKL